MEVVSPRSFLPAWIIAPPLQLVINVVHFARRRRNDVADGCLLQCLQYAPPPSYNAEMKPASSLADCDGKRAVF